MNASVFLRAVVLIVVLLAAVAGPPGWISRGPAGFLVPLSLVVWTSAVIGGSRGGVCLPLEARALGFVGAVLGLTCAFVFVRWWTVAQYGDLVFPADELAYPLSTMTGELGTLVASAVAVAVAPPGLACREFGSLGCALVTGALLMLAPYALDLGMFSHGELGWGYGRPMLLGLAMGAGSWAGMTLGLRGRAKPGSRVSRGWGGGIYLVLLTSLGVMWAYTDWPYAVWLVAAAHLLRAWSVPRAKRAELEGLRCLLLVLPLTVGLVVLEIWGASPVLPPWIEDSLLIPAPIALCGTATIAGTCLVWWARRPPRDSAESFDPRGFSLDRLRGVT